MPGASFAALRGVHFMGASKAVSVGVDSRALVWELAPGWGAKTLEVKAAGSASGSRPEVGIDVSPAHELASLIEAGLGPRPIELDEEPCATEAAAAEAGMQLKQVIELQVGDVGGTALRSGVDGATDLHLLAVNGQGCEVLLLQD